MIRGRREELPPMLPARLVRHAFLVGALLASALAAAAVAQPARDPRAGQAEAQIARCDAEAARLRDPVASESRPSPL
jgi:hypothetical protein